MTSQRSRHVRYKAGDVFRIALPDKSFGYGRILLDVFRVRREGVFSPMCSLTGPYGSGLLVQLYRYTTTTPLTDPEELTDADTFLDELLAHDQILLGEHPIIGSIPVAPVDIGFPEYVTSHRPATGKWHYCFEKGGVVAELAHGWRALRRGVIRQVDDAAVQKLPRGSYGLGINTDSLLTHIESPTGIVDRAREDLRASRHRNRILRLAGFSSEMTYDEMATQMDTPAAKDLLAIVSTTRSV